MTYYEQNMVDYKILKLDELLKVLKQQRKAGIIEHALITEIVYRLLIQEVSR